MSVAKPQALTRQPVDVGRSNLCCSVTADVAVTQVIRINHDDVGPVGCLACQYAQVYGQRQTGKSLEHAYPRNELVVHGHPCPSRQCCYLFREPVKG